MSPYRLVEDMRTPRRRRRLNEKERKEDRDRSFKAEADVRLLVLTAAGSLCTSCVRDVRGNSDKKHVNSDDSSSDGSSKSSNAAARVCGVGVAITSADEFSENSLPERERERCSFGL